MLTCDPWAPGPSAALPITLLLLPAGALGSSYLHKRLLPDAACGAAWHRAEEIHGWGLGGSRGDAGTVQWSTAMQKGAVAGAHTAWCSRVAQVAGACGG